MKKEKKKLFTKKNQVIKWIIQNKMPIIFTAIGLVVGLGIMALFIPKRIAKLENGQEPLVTLNGFTITADEYYEQLKETISIELILQNIDTKILNKMYETTNELQIEITKKMQETITEYTNYYKYTESDFLKENGFKSKNEFFELLLLNHKRDLYYKEYAKTLVKNEEINNYYLKSLNPDMEIKYLLIDDLTVVNNVLSDLKNGKSYNDIVTSYKGKVDAYDQKYVAFDDTSINADIYAAAIELDSNTYTGNYITIDGRYCVVFKGKVKEKDSIDTIKDRIISVIRDKKVTADTDGKIYYQALDKLRSDNGIVFNDTVLKNNYNTYMKNYR